MAKLLFPDEVISKEYAAMMLEYAIEGRRRVKEQLKIMAGVEFIDVNLGYVDLYENTEIVVAAPEQFDSIYDAGMEDYLASGGQDIIDERAEKIGYELK